MKGPSQKLKSCRGAALLLSLWALFLLSAMVITWTLSINSRLAVSSNANRVLAAEAMASSGAEVSLCREVTPSSPNLHRQMGDGGYDVQITGECGRLNLNFLVQGEDPVKLQVLRQYLNLKGIDLNDLDVMMDSLVDWVSQNKGLHRLNACPEGDDYHPPHAGQLFSVDELKKVCGWEEFTSKPGWDQDFTVVGNGCGRIDLAWASRDVLRALPGLSDDGVDRFLQLRRGPDGIDGTADDFQFVTTGGTVPPEALAALGLNQLQYQQIQQLVGFKLPVMHIVSVGKSGEVTRSVEEVVSKQVLAVGAPGGVQAGVPVGGTTAIGIGRPTIFSWKEL